MQLPQIKDDNIPMQLMQSRWASILNPLLAKPLSSANILKGVQLINGVNVVNHLLGRQMQGWLIGDINAAAQVFRSEPMDNLTLTLTSDADCVVDLIVY